MYLVLSYSSGTHPHFQQVERVSSLKFAETKFKSNHLSLAFRRHGRMSGRRALVSAVKKVCGRERPYSRPRRGHPTRILCQSEIVEAHPCLEGACD